VTFANTTDRTLVEWWNAGRGNYAFGPIEEELIRRGYPTRVHPAAGDAQRSHGADFRGGRETLGRRALDGRRTPSLAAVPPLRERPCQTGRRRARNVKSR